MLQITITVIIHLLRISLMIQIKKNTFLKEEYNN